MNETVNVISISGGKDSTAMWLFALENNIRGNILPVFADTGHEHPMTYEYIDYLQNELGPVKIVKADFTKQINKKREYVQTKWRDEGVSEKIIQNALEALQPTGNPFLDLCLWKGRFPSTKARFCTQFLKRNPIFDQVYVPLMEQRKQIVSMQGIRRQESLARANLSEWEDTPEGIKIYRPIIDWTVEQVFEMHKKHGIKPNPLYYQGMGRVGCMPCINVNKLELFEIARRYPEEVHKIARWEEIVSKASKQGSATFFCTREDWGESIFTAVEWSKTAYGGKQYDLEKLIEFEDVPLCSSQYGLCE